MPWWNSPGTTRSRSGISCRGIRHAVGRFNPAFGQGMSVAAMEATTLKRLLARLAETGDAVARLATAFFAEIQPVLDMPWGIATADFIYPQTTGERPPDFEAGLRFQAALTSLAARGADKRGIS